MSILLVRKKGKYILEIQLSEEAFTGDFELE